MAYLDQDQGHVHKRLAGITGVALIHIALAFGLAAGLTIKYTLPPDEPTIIGLPVNTPPPPPDEPAPSDPDLTLAPPVSAPLPPVSLGPPPVIHIAPTIPQPPEVIRVPEILTIPEPRPSFAAVRPEPRNGPGGWVTTRDYPRVALVRGWEGTARYAVEVNLAGRVTDCRITSSTGHEVLDDATCRYITRRARFDPARNTSGEEVSGTFTGAVTWQIPD